MRNTSLVLSFALLSLVVISTDVFAQSGSRGRPRLPSAVQSRVGGARSKTIPSRARPTGMMNSANALIRSGQAGNTRGGSGSRGPSLPSTRTPSFGGGGVAGGGGYSGRSSVSTSGISRPSRRSKSSTGTIAAGAPQSLTPSMPLPEGFRVWKDSTGRYSIQGKLAAQQNGMVWIRRTDGKLTKLPMTKLSTADQQFLTRGS